MSNLEDLCEQIEAYFITKGFGWRRDGEIIYPRAEQIKDALLRMSSEVLELSNGSLIESGRLLIKTNGPLLDVYLWEGTLDAGTIRSQA